MRIGTLKTGWNFFSQNFETFAGSLKRWKGEKKLKPGQVLQGPSRTRPSGFSEKTKLPNTGSNPVVCRLNSCRPVTNELDLGVPVACQVGSAVVLQRNERIKKGGALPSK